MLAKRIKCEVVQKTWLTPTVFSLKFRSNKNLKFLPGQFLSIFVPKGKNEKAVRRAYSFANSPEMAKQEGYELCIKHVPGGTGSEFMASLNPGDQFEATAPYGHFLYLPPARGRFSCFISTSTGIAPFRSMILSEDFLSHQPDRCFFIFGARSESEFLYKQDLEMPGLELTLAVSRAENNGSGFHGRVTDYLRSLPSAWHWHNTDFYLCGSPEMVQEVVEILKGGHGVNDKSIHREAFAAPSALKKTG